MRLRTRDHGNDLLSFKGGGAAEAAPVKLLSLEPVRNIEGGWGREGKGGGGGTMGVTCSASGVAEAQRWRLSSASSLECRMLRYCRLTLLPRDACCSSTAALTSPSRLQHLLSSLVMSLHMHLIVTAVHFYVMLAAQACML